MNINRHNYEEFFLLYIDNELTAVQRNAVEQFIQENPDLAGELDLFRQTSLVSDEAIVFDGKELLMRKENGATINLDNYEEWLVAYIDNELSVADRMAVEKFAAVNPSVKEALAIFQQTKLQPEENIVFANKEILYKREEKVRVVTMQWWKIAVAASVLLAVGITTISVLNRNTTVPNGLANTSKTRGGQGKTDKEKTGMDIKKESPIQPVVIEKNEAVASINTEKKKESAGQVQKTKPENLQKKNIVNQVLVNNDVIAKTTKPVVNESSTNRENIIAKKTNDIPVPENKEAAALNNTVAVNNTAAKENINNSTVTNKTDKPSEDKETAYVNPVETGAVFASNNEEGKNKKLRGFFRKATRIFEKRTNVSAADDDDKVLIGVLAVRLK